MCNFTIFLARLCLSAIFIYAGIQKFLFHDATLQYMAAKNLPAVPVLLVLAALVELIGGACLIIGFKTRTAAALLLLFLIPATYLFHDFWNVGGADKQLQTLMFLKNIAIMGGLLLLIACGSGRCGVDACCRGSKGKSDAK